MVLVDRRGQRYVATIKLPLAAVRRVGHGKLFLSGIDSPEWAAVVLRHRFSNLNKDWTKEKRLAHFCFYFIRLPIEAQTDKLSLPCYGNCPPKSRERSVAMPRRLY